MCKLNSKGIQSRPHGNRSLLTKVTPQPPRPFHSRSRLSPGNGHFPWSGALNSLNFQQHCQPGKVFKIPENGKGKCFRCMLAKIVLKDGNQDIT